jgi:uncharacterized membrane protein
MKTIPMKRHISDTVSIKIQASETLGAVIDGVSKILEKSKDQIVLKKGNRILTNRSDEESLSSLGIVDKTKLLVQLRNK